MMVAEAPKGDDHKHGGMPDMSGMGGMGHVCGETRGHGAVSSSTVAFARLLGA